MDGTVDPSKFLGFTTDEWQAIGSIATAGAFLIAAAAVIVAFLQLRHARVAAEKQLKQDRENTAQQLQQNQEMASQQLEQNRRAAAEQLEQDRHAMKAQLEQAQRAALDQSRPYVLLSMQLSPISFAFLDLVLENAGAGPAYDVTIKVDPPLKRVKETPGDELAKARIFTAALPMLPPHYRLRTFLDSALDRYNADAAVNLPDSHEVTIEYHDGRGNNWKEVSILDMTVPEGLLFSEEYGIHHIAKALREIRDFLKKSKVFHTPVAVTVEDRATYLQRIQAERDEQLRKHTEIAKRVQARSQPSAAGTNPKPEG